MLEIQYIRQNAEEVINRLAIKNVDAKDLLKEILALDEQRRAVQTKLDDVLAQLNKASKEIGDLFKAGKKAEADELKNKTTAFKETITLLEGEGKKAEKALQDKLVLLPNMPHKSVPKG